MYQDVSMNDPNANHVGVHSRGNSPNISNESAIILGLVVAIQTGNGTRHTVSIEYQAAPKILEVLLDGHLVLFSENFKLTDWIELPSFVGITGSGNNEDHF